jgi:hypothetical protein
MGAGDSFFLQATAAKAAKIRSMAKAVPRGLKIQEAWGFEELLSGHGMLGGLFCRRF